MGEPYRNTKQNLVKERHQYVNSLVSGLNTHEMMIEFEINGQKQFFKSRRAAAWLDTFFQHLIGGKPRTKLERWVLDTLGREFLTLNDIKQLIKIRIERIS